MWVTRNNENIVNYEVNFLTEYAGFGRGSITDEIKAEFDLIQLWQSMINPFGLSSRYYLDRFMAVSLRKLLCDKTSPLIRMYPDFLMPPLYGERFDCPGDETDMKLVQIHPDIHVKPQNEWIPLNEWLKERIAWIDKDVNSIPDAYTDSFYSMIIRKIDKNVFSNYVERDEVIDSGEKRIIWRIKDKSVVFDELKKHGYYDLSIKRMIKHIADKQGAHLDMTSSPWVRMSNDGIKVSAISAFSSQMIYAATVQIKELEDYYLVKPVMETL